MGEQNKSIDEQIAVLQNAYNPHGIAFSTSPANRTWTINATWVQDSNAVETFKPEFKRKLHKGDFRTVNLYIVKNLGPYGTCPLAMAQAQVAKPDKELLDGCLVRTDTLPGSAIEMVNGGKTAVHEIGHWFGLWHPYENHGLVDGPNGPSGCLSNNDEVDDTPAMKDRVENCDSPKDTCPKQPGNDPLDNYMGNCPDRFMTTFTPGQV